MASSLSGGERSEIAFFDLETAVPTKQGKPFAILEFGAILVCPRKLVELYNYSTLVKPTDLSLISTLTKRRSGITRDGVLSAPTFSEIADKVYDILNGRIWAGHNIKRFDCVRIREAFAEIGLSPPEPKATIDSLSLLTEKFGKRAGDMKMASLATYFELGDQAHRSLDDVRMNLEVVKYCATVLFLESSVPDILTEMSWFSPRRSPRTRSNKKSLLDGDRESSASSSSSPKTDRSFSSVDATTEENHPIVSLLTEFYESDTSCSEIDSSDITTLISKLHIGTLQTDSAEEAQTVTQHDEPTPSMLQAKDESFLCVDKVSVSSISASLVPSYGGTPRMKLFHNDAPMHLCCYGLKVRFGISRKFLDHAGRPRLNIVVDVPPDLCKILDASDAAARNLWIDSDSSSNSDWRHTVMRKEGFANYPTARLQISSESNGDEARCGSGTRVYLKEPSETIQYLEFNSDDFKMLESALLPGTLVDAFFSLDPYDYQQMAGIRLAAKKLVIHPKK